MIRTNIQKRKLLYVMRIMYEESDESHMLTIKDIILKLREYGIEAERKSIYTDLKTLRDCGIDISDPKGKSAAYYVKNRQLDTNSLKMLIDVVQSSDVISSEKADELTERLKNLTSVNNRQELLRPPIVTHRPKSMKTGLYESIDKVQSAIMKDVKLSMKYFSWIIAEDMKVKKKVSELKVSPLSLYKDGSEYSLLCYEDSMGVVTYLNLARIFDIEYLDEKRKVIDRYENPDICEFILKKKEKAGGILNKVTLSFDNKFIDEVMDHMYEGAIFKKDARNRFSVSFDIHVSNSFFGWVSGFGTGVKIISPKDVAEAYKIYLSNLINLYD